MGIIKKLKSVLVRLGLRQLKGTLIVVGLTNSGKTTIVNSLKPPETQLEQIAPTVGFSVEQVRIEKCKLTVIDLSGQQKYAKLWECYYEDAQGIIFVVDAADVDQLAQSKEVLMNLVTNDRLQRLPLLIFANKSDLPESLTSVEVSTRMELTANLHVHKSWNIFASSGLTGEGIRDGMRWMLSLMKK